MKGFYRLLNHEFSTMIRAVIIISFGAIVTPLFFLRAAVQDYGTYTVHERFEDIYTAAGCSIIFWIYLAALCAYFLKTVYAGYWGSKSIYTYLTLPIKREVLYYGKLASFIICLVILLAAQLISIRLGYAVVADKVGSYDSGRFLMADGLFLASIRSEFIRLFLPVSLDSFLSSFSMLLTLVTGVYYGALIERSKRYWGYVIVAGAALVMIQVMNSRMSRPGYGMEYLYGYSVTLLVISGFFMWHSIRLIRRGSIA